MTIFCFSHKVAFYTLNLDWGKSFKLQRLHLMSDAQLAGVEMIDDRFCCNFWIVLGDHLIDNLQLYPYEREYSPLPQIDHDRLFHTIQQLAQIGQLPTGGVQRLAFSPEDIAARQQVKQWIQAAGMSVRTDEAGNIFKARSLQFAKPSTTATPTYPVVPVTMLKKWQSSPTWA
jgi:hypothetical protein